MNATRAKRRAPTGRTWLIRLGVALVLGLAVGAGAGVFTVNTLEPGRPGVADSLQLMLDSIAKAPPAAAPQPAPPAETARATAPAAVSVPSVVDLDEGAARDALMGAGLQVGEVRFAPSPKAAGTVLATEPAAGTSVPTGTPVVIILSDGRPPADTGAALPPDFRRFPAP